MAAQGNEDPTWHLMLFLAAILGVCWLIWYFFRMEILETMRYVRLAELWIIGLVNHEAHACFDWVRVAPIGNGIPPPEAFAAAINCFGSDNLRRMPPAEAIKFYNLTPTSLGVITGLISRYTKWFTIIVCAVTAIYALYFTPRNRFKTMHNLESFIKTQAKMWPVISPIVNFFPSRVSARVPGSIIPDKMPVFAEALSPEEWISYHRIPVANGIPERERVRRAFLLQLGPRWQGLDDQPLYIVALFAAFSLMGAQKREEAEDLLGRLATTWSAEQGLQMPDKLIAEVKRIVKDPALGGEAMKVANLHAYRTTAMLGVLKSARFAGGVLAPAQFLWLRGVDRDLWYPLNNLGRRAFHSEGSGAMAHFMAEATAKKPLPIPRVDTAIVALNQYLAANPAVVIPPREEPNAIESSRKV